MKDYYNVLGLQKGASKEEIKKAYRNLSKEHHPDISGNESDGRFKEISEAYEILSDKSKKYNYDNYGNSNNSRGDSNSNSNHSGQNPWGDVFGGQNPFENFNGFRGGNNNRQENLDIEVNVTVNLDEIFNLGSKKIRYKFKKSCNSCSGEGGEGVTTCTTCNGKGRVIHNTGGFFNMITEQICTSCDGKGKKIKTPCNTCNGSGDEDSIESFDLSIPPGAHQRGAYFKYREKGNQKDRRRGDLLVSFSINDYKGFSISGNNLLIKKYISYPEMLLGTRLFIKTVDSNTIEISVPGKILDGNVLRVKGKGMPISNTQKADLFIEIHLKHPENLSDRETEILKELMKQPNFKNKN